MSKLLSIIIPTYNMEKYLGHCMNSLVSIPWKQLQILEIIIVNDGSKDSSLEIAESFKKKYPDSVVLIDKPNGNYGSCINSALKIASGKYIRVLDADDSFDSGAFSNYLRELSKVNVDLIITPYMYVYLNTDKEKLVDFHLPYNKIMSFSEAEAYASFKSLQMHAITYKTENIREIDYYQTEGISYTDQEWISIPMLAVKSVIVFDTVVYKYSMGREGQTMDRTMMIKQILHQMMGIKHQLVEFTKVLPQIASDYALKRYMTDKLLIRILEVYKTYLIKRSKGLNMRDLIEFDLFIEENCPYIYDLVFNYKVRNWLPFKFIRQWKLNNKINLCFYWGLKFYYFLTKK